MLTNKLLSLLAAKACHKFPRISRQKKYIFIVLVFCVCGCSFVFAQDELAGFTKDDRVLVLAPHPDDEAISCAGVIQRALASGASVKVVCYTNGDNNEFAFIVYEKRLTFRKGEFLHMGAVRAKETMSAMKFLGEGEQDVSYMGYPDFGTMDILTKYWDTARPYRSMFPRVQKVSYPNAISAGSAYTGESILRDIKTVLSAFKPTHVFVSHPADTNRDHQSLYLFLQVALWDMEGRISAPKVHPYLVHVIGWPRPRGKHPEMALHPPGELDSAAWKQLVLSGDELAKKQECISFYKSQIMCNPPYLYTFARKNELYGDFSPVVLRQSCRGAVDWQVVGDGDEAGANGAFLSYAVVDKDLLIKVALNRKIDKRLGLYINLLGYNRKKDFAGMPKLEIKVGLLGMRIKDKKEVVFIRGAKLRFENTTAYVSVPLSSLGDPDFIMAKVRRRLFRVPLDVSSWRILEVS